MQVLPDHVDGPSGSIAGKDLVGACDAAGCRHTSPDSGTMDEDARQYRAHRHGPGDPVVIEENINRKRTRPQDHIAERKNPDKDSR